MQESEIAGKDSDIRLDRWFRRYYPQVSQVELQKMLRKKLVRVNGKKAEANQRLQAGDKLRHPEFAEHQPRKPKPTAPQKPDWLDEAILYRDENIIVLNKPAGLATQGGSKQRTHLDRLLPLLQREGEEVPKLVHRLDKDTSGLLLLACHAKAADVLMKAFTAREITKRYWALCVGVPSPAIGELSAPILKRVKSGEEKMAVGRDGKPAKTEYEVLERFAQKLSFVELTPHTGRKHQLRVHMDYLDCPILGDAKYGGQRSFPSGLQVPKKLHLHARQLQLPVHCFGKEMVFTAPIPPHFRESFKLLEVDIARFSTTYDAHHA